MITSFPGKKYINDPEFFKKYYRQKTIMHIDYDSFFASVEQQANPFLRKKPMGVTGSSLSKGVVCASSREAKKLGIKTGTPIFKAKEIYPDFIAVKGDFTKYQYIQKKSLEIFSKYTDLVEPFSIDESFLDITSTLEFFDSIESLTAQVKKDIKNAFGEYVTCSVGVGPNKLMAKLVSDFNKPNGLYIVDKHNMQQTLLTAKLQDFCGIGGRIEARLNNLDIFCVKDLQETSFEKLFKEFGNVQAHFLKNLSFGIDFSPVQHIEKKHKPKSIGHQHTLSKNTKDINVIKNNIRRMCEMVSRRLRRHEMLGKTLGLYLRDSEFRGYFERTTLTYYTESGGAMYKNSTKLMEKIFDRHGKKELRLVGVSVSKLIYKDQLPLYLFPQDQKVERIIKASDMVNDKFGEFTMVTADTLLADRTKGKISSFLRH